MFLTINTSLVLLYNWKIIYQLKYKFNLNIKKHYDFIEDLIANVIFLSISVEP